MDTALVGVGEVRRRIAALTGVSRLLQLEGHLLVLLSRPLRVDAARAPGLVLVEHSGWLCGLPLSQSALERLGAPEAGGALLVVRSGAVEVHPLSRLAEVDPSAWVDLSAFEWLVAEPLRPAPERDAPEPGLAPSAEPELLERAGVVVSAREMAELRAVRESAFGEARNLREVLDAELANAVPPGAALQARKGLPLRGREEAPAARKRRERWRFDQQGARLLARLLTFLALLLRPRGDAPQALPPADDEAAPSARGRAARPVPGRKKRKGAKKRRPDTDFNPPDPSWLQRLSQTLQGWASRLVLRSQLGQVLMRRQAEFLQETLNLFDRGDWDEALKRALPLGGEASEEAPKPPSLALPRPRSELAIQPWSKGATSSLGLGMGLYDDMRRRYRRAFEALVERGEIEKAAFVLAELLHANEEAVSFLERHNRLTLAAELAEARKLAPGLVVRQWLLAGNRQRAMRLAERHAAFADAISRLREGHPDLALQLRALWADRLATVGDYVGALEAAWGVVELRSLSARWAELASRVGGVVTARMLVRLLRAAPEKAPEVFAQVESLSAGLAARAAEDAEWLVLRTLAEELVQGAERQVVWSLPPEEARVLARLLAPRLLSALGRRGDGVPGRHTPLRDLFELSGDPVLDFSLSHAKGQGTPRVPQRVLSIERGASDVGSLPIRDAVLLPDGKYLVAVGEIGLWVVNPHGKVMQRFAEPTDRIVISRHGDRAILLARRGEVWRLSRLDLVARRIQPWRDARIDLFATEFDGQRWFIGRNEHPSGRPAANGELFAVDVTEEWEAESLISDPRPILAIAAGGSCVRAVIGNGQEAEVWEHELPALTLRRRTALPDIGQLLHTSVNSEGDVCVAAQTQATQFKGFALPVFTPSSGVRYALPDTPTVGAPCLGRCLVVPCTQGNTFIGRVFRLDALLADSHSVQVSLMGRNGAPKGSMRLCDQQLLIFDDRGRLLHCDLDRRELVAELRVTL